MVFPTNGERQVGSIGGLVAPSPGSGMLLRLSCASHTTAASLTSSPSRMLLIVCCVWCQRRNYAKRDGVGTSAGRSTSTNKAKYDLLSPYHLTAVRGCSSVERPVILRSDGISFGLLRCNLRMLEAGRTSCGVHCCSQRAAYLWTLSAARLA